MMIEQFFSGYLPPFSSSAFPILTTSFFIITAYFLILSSLRKIHLHYAQSDKFLSKVILESFGPLTLFLRASCLIILAIVLIGDFETYTGIPPVKIFNIVALASVSWFIISVISLIERNFIEQNQSKFDITAIQTISKLIRLALILALALSLLPYLGFDLTGLLALSATGTVVLGIASKDLLSNFFGGLMIFVDKPFGVGDWIKCSEKSIEGRVISIGWRLTCILSPERRPLYIPNSFFTNAVVENSTRMENRRIKHFIHLPYKDIQKIPKIIQEIKNHLLTCPDIDSKNKQCFFHVTQLASNHVECMLYCFTKATEWEKFLDIQQKIIFEVLRIISDNDSSVALPLSEVNIKHIND